MASDSSFRPRRQGFLHGAAILTAGALAAKVIGALFKIPLTRILGPEGAGHFGVAYSIYIVLLNVSSTGLPLAVSRLISEADTLGRRRQVQSIHRISLCMFLLLGGVCSGVMYFGARGLADWMRDPDAVHAIRVLAPAVLFVCGSGAFRGYFQGQQEMTSTAAAQVLEAVSKLVIGLAALGLALGAGWDIPRAAGAAILGVSVGAGLGCGYFAWQYRVRPKCASSLERPAPVWTTAAGILRLAVPITVGAAATQIIQALAGRIILGRLQDALGYDPGGASALYGIYTMAQTLYLLPAALVQPLTVSVIPAVTEAMALGDREEAQKRGKAALILTALIALPAGVGLSILSVPIQRLLYGYDAGTLAIAGPTLAVLGIAVPFSCLVLVTNAILQARGRAVYAVCSAVAGGGANLAVTYALVGDPRFHILGAAIGTLAGGAVTLGGNALLLKRLSEKFRNDQQENKK